MSDASPRCPLLGQLYEQFLEHNDLSGYVEQVRARYSQGTLERLAEHPKREIRRATIQALGSLGDYSANHTMGRALSDEDRAVRSLAESGIRTVWVRAGDARQQRLLEIISQRIAAGRHREAIRRATRLIEQTSWYAEAWNQRAIAHFSLSQFAEAIRDCHETLEINPYHFAAAAGMGQAYLELGNRAAALDAFRRALRLYPDMETVRAQVDRLGRSVEGL
jgi:tetratricopeptide (TPR) repeat protein